MATKYYAVKKGKTPGIYTSWDECKAQVDGFSGAVYKSFKTMNEAEDFIGAQLDSSKLKDVTGPDDDLPEMYAFVDGSYNIATGVYGYGGFLIDGKEKHILQGAGDDEEMASMRNVAGEILGSQTAIQKAIELGLKEISIYYDYAGIEMWATGAWKRNKVGTIAYYDYIQAVKDQIKIRFIKVKGHSGIDGNEEADALAKQAVGIEE